MPGMHDRHHLLEILPDYLALARPELARSL